MLQGQLIRIIQTQLQYSLSVLRCSDRMPRDVLQRISGDDVTKLLNVLKQDLPSSIVAHNWLVTHLEWSSHLPQLTVHVLCPRGEWQQGTVVAFADGLALENKKYGVVYARPRHDADLAAALTSTRAVPWHDMYQFGGVLERHVAMVRDGATAAGVSLPANQPPLFHLFYTPPSFVQLFSQLQQRKPKAGVRVLRLEARHLDEVWNLRPIYPDFYKPVIRACLEHNLSAGVFLTRPDGSEVLASMVTGSEYGGMGMGQTLTEYLHRGFNSLAGELVIRSLVERGMLVFGWTATTNQLVLRYIGEFGFELVDKVARVIISPGGELKGRL